MSADRPEATPVPDRHAEEWPSVEIVRCRDVGDLLLGARCGYAGANELACPNHLPCPGRTYVSLGAVVEALRGRANRLADRGALGDATAVFRAVDELLARFGSGEGTDHDE